MMPGLGRVPTYQERKQIQADALEEEYGDFDVEDLPETIGAFTFDFADEDGEVCEKLDETYVWTTDDRSLEISKHERRHGYDVLTRREDGVGFVKDEEVGSYGYLGRAVEAAEDAFGGEE